MSASMDQIAVWLSERGPRGLVKICGLREPAHAVAAVQAGADLLGFVFAPTRRQVTAATARTCIAAARVAAGERSILAVGVFVNAPAAVINATAEEAGLDLVQLHGEEDPALGGALKRPVIASLRPRPGATAGNTAAMIEARLSAATPPVLCLIDGYDPNAPGGTGQRADWALAAALARRHRLLLAGGLDPANVGAAIRQVGPLGVDVSSGVETDGIKDPAKIAAFGRAARAAFAARQAVKASAGR